MSRKSSPDSWPLSATCIWDFELENYVAWNGRIWTYQPDKSILTGKWVYVFLDHTKTHLERKIDLIPKAIEIFRILEKAAPNHKPNDYIFAEGSQYLTLRSFNYVLEHTCKQIGIDPKRSHKLRKTYASRLNAAGLPLDQIRANLGHTNSSTTLGYIYNPLTPKESLAIMEKAF